MDTETLIPDTDEAMKKAVEYTLHEFASVRTVSYTHLTLPTTERV